MRTNRFTRLTAIAVAAGITALAAPAGAIPTGSGGGTSDPPAPVARPDLVVSALSITPALSTPVSPTTTLASTARGSTVRGSTAPGSTAPVSTTAALPVWSIAYTVANIGAVPAASTKISFVGSGPLAERSVSDLAVGATRAGTLSVPRSACFLALTAVADSRVAVIEGSETNNTKRVMGVSPPCPPRYRVEAVSFKAVDESGWDDAGSDEPYWIFNSVGSAGTATSKASGVFGNVDSGNTRFFGPEGCIWGCSVVGDPAPVGVGLSVQLWESDGGNVSDTLSNTAKMFQDVGAAVKDFGDPAWIGTVSSAIGKALAEFDSWYKDDLLGNNTYGYSAAELASLLPTPGSFTNDRRYGGSDADYRLITRVTRIV